MAGKLQWYWHRLQAMSLREMLLHARKKARHFHDGRGVPDWSGHDLKCSEVFPILPAATAAPELLRETLQTDARNILRGHWLAFGHLPLQVDDPPRWHKDYLVSRDFSTTTSAFKLDHRALTEGADIKLIWELSRWYQLVRLAMAAHVSNDHTAAIKCVEWLEDWVKHNPPYRGWNWTSALEAGMRLIQFTWMDGLLTQSLASEAKLKSRWDKLRAAILPPHVWYCWRYKSFGSSANNHLLSELVGLILAVVRWPELKFWAMPLEELQRLWEREVLAQFAEDGGNREQALNYQLFSFEFCWQARLALLAAGQKISPEVEKRLALAAGFFRDVQVRADHWDYGDSDSAYVTPFFARESTLTSEWHEWVATPEKSPAISYWLGQPPQLPPPPVTKSAQWSIYPQSGIAFCEHFDRQVRWDLSPLGYLKTAAHGHLDALHLSLWQNGVAMVIDPGTGCYYADKKLRNWLASRAAHNAPCPVGEEWPHRMGPFLWKEHHRAPTWQKREIQADQPTGVAAELSLVQGALERSISLLSDGQGVKVADVLTPVAGHSGEFIVRWQFAPGSTVKRLSECEFVLTRSGQSLQIQLDPAWERVELVEQRAEDSLEGIVSQRFRQTQWAPFLKLHARPTGNKPCVFFTTFLASPRS